ncbi:hypothetical protein MAPG_06853 [Magnaporthiopsis poae ATCC 64411]|uniref:Pre-rRNA-processing protein RIX1 n=1 Tax=Magnaporthiopsis poae (strain ATCC 64411 / 73-15) TaxID=644358 RepID=A0A0C4E361_MAGP6|nr:hypothetical protein MAPG_06853 [Magnaporthiopsis poae ATCC 64411]
MATASPDLRVVCRKLVSTPADDLLRVCPSLVNHVLRCGRSLSAPAEARPKDGANEAAMLVHKLKTHITTLLNGRTPASRFAGMVLVKAVVDVGGWECLRTAEPWVRGLLSMLQKPDPESSKELCLVTLVRIYTLLHEYPTLIREMATPTLPAFATACLQILKPSSSAKLPKASAGLVETAVCALAAIVPLFPTTLRPFNGQIRAAVRAYVAPTLSDPEPVPQSLRECSRRLMLALHHTAPKNTHADEWAGLLAGWLRDSHATADQVFRAVQESWEPPSGHTAREVSTDDKPQGGGKQPNELPPWTGLDSGAQRLRGLLEAMSDCMGTATRSSVALPVAGLTDLVARILLVLPPPPGVADRDLAMQLNPNVGREERDELWSVLPQLHIAALQLAHSLAQRLGRNLLPITSDILDQAVRALASYPQLADMRQTVFALIRDLLPICGPTLPRISVDSLAPTLQLCCHDLLVASGFAQDETQDNQAKANGTKVSGVQANADLFLPNKNTASSSSSAAIAPTAAGLWQQKPSAPSAAHLAAAEALLEAALSHLPQQHLKKAERALLDRTAILCRSKGAMLAGVLNPYVDKSGRAFANTFPFLARQYPGDAAVELLRTNLRTKPHHFGSVFIVDGRHRGGGEEEGDDDNDDNDGAEDEAGDGRRGIAARSTLTGVFRSQDPGSDVAAEATTTSAAVVGFSRYFESAKMEVDGDETQEPGQGSTKPGGGQPAEEEAPFVPLVLKRKNVDHDDDDDDEPMGAPAKRQDKGKTASVAAPLTPHVGGDSSDSDDESVKLEMVLDDDEEDEDEDEED